MKDYVVKVEIEFESDKHPTHTIHEILERMLSTDELAKHYHLLGIPKTLYGDEKS